MTNEKQVKAEGVTCMEIIMFGVFLLGMVLMFSKTADLLAAFAPTQVLGYTGLEQMYGVACALLVEGLVAAMKIKMLFMGRAKSAIEWGWDVILTLFPFVLSSLAQVFDSFLVRNTIDQQPEEIKFMLNWGVPLIPSLIILGILVWGFIQSAPEGMFAGVGNSAGGSGFGFKLPKFSNPFGRKNKPASAQDPTPPPRS